MTPNGGKKDLLHTQYVANKYFGTVEWKRHRASIILSKKKKMFATIFAEISPLFAPVTVGVIFWGSHFGLGASKFHGYTIRYTHTHTHRHKHIPTDEHHNSTIAYSYNAAMHLPYPEPTLTAETGTFPWRFFSVAAPRGMRLTFTRQCRGRSPD